MTLRIVCACLLKPIHRLSFRHSRERENSTLTTDHLRTECEREVMVSDEQLADGKDDIMTYDRKRCRSGVDTSCKLRLIDVTPNMIIMFRDRRMIRYYPFKTSRKV
jgi:hypothetical protein